VDAEFKQRLTPTLLRNIVTLVPDAWLKWDGTEEGPEELRAIYLEFLRLRLAQSHVFTNEAQHARQALV
jgi:hypothetical protein